MVLGMWIDFHNHTIFSKGSSRHLHATCGHRRWSGANYRPSFINKINSCRKTLQTTTVAAQASVPRQDVSVVTAFRNVSDA